MSSKVDNIDVEVPEASPDSNAKEAPPKDASSTRKWIALAVFLAVIIATAIAIPLALKKDVKKDTDAAVSPDSSNAASTVSQCFEPKEGDDCTTQESYQQCLDLANAGCQEIISTFSCPPIHACGDAPTPETLPEMEQCPPPTEGDNCITEESHKQCMDLVNAGCQTIYSTFSCPPLHRCGDQPTQLPETPEDAVACTMELHICPDGTSVGRTGPNCEFEPCPETPEDAVACTMELHTCPDGTSVGRTGPNCEFEPCPVLAACTMELRYCADGTPVGRSGPNCHFESCPDGGCPTDTYYCENGTELQRDPALGCEFQACPEPAQLPAAHQCIPPSEDNTCTTQESHKECMDLVNSGCQKIYSTFSCPPMHRCGDEPAQLPAPVLAACTMELAFCADGSPVGRSGPNCQFESCPDGGCPTDTYLCDDGTELPRDPALGCEFASCQETAVERNVNSPPALGACTREFGICADGTPVGRSGPNCYFEACPDGACPIDSYTCGDGTELLRDPALGCEFAACPTPKAEQLSSPALGMCTRELAICSDGTPVGRHGPNCFFEACPDGACPIDTYTCDDGTELIREPSLGCEFASCPTPVLSACTMELAICADGTSLGRSGPNCEFGRCPDGSCPPDTFTCNGTELKRDPALGCVFPVCESL